MKNKGFTLIELLAVIVILAIIALIATPIILNIIEDAREESNERSVDMFGRSIQNALARHQLNGGESLSGIFTQPNEDKKELVQGTTKLTVEYDGEDVVCSTIEIHKDGTIFLDGCGIKEVGNISYGTRKKICKPVEVATTGVVPSSREDYETVKYKAGDEYTCEVKDGIWYKFFVVSLDEENVNLIMYANINDDGVPVDSDEVENKGYTDWLSVSKYTELGGQITEEMLIEGSCEGGGHCSNNSYGPISAMDYLEKATSTWTNLNPMKINKFKDYKDNFVNMKKSYTTYSRLPYKSEITNAGDSALYLIDYLNFDQKPNEILNDVTGPMEYWTATSDTLYNTVIVVTTDSNAYPNYYYYEFIGNSNGNGIYTGVRPVITVSKDQIENNE